MGKEGAWACSQEGGGLFCFTVRALRPSSSPSVSGWPRCEGASGTACGAGAQQAVGGGHAGGRAGAVASLVSEGTATRRFTGVGREGPCPALHRVRGEAWAGLRAQGDHPDSHQAWFMLLPFIPASGLLSTCG